MRKQSIGVVPVKYVGRRPEFFDRIYGSGLFFDQGQTRLLPAELARKLLRHADLFERAEADPADPQQEDDTAEILEEATRKQSDLKVEQSVIQDLRDSVQSMDKDALSLFASTNYRQIIDRRRSVETLREEVLGFIDRFGAV